MQLWMLLELCGALLLVPASDGGGSVAMQKLEEA